MKTLQEIIERKDYVRINAALKMRAYELAEKIRAKFEELCEIWDSRKKDYPEQAVEISDKWYCVRYNVSSYNGRKETEGTCLCVLPNKRLDDWWSLENQPHAVYATNTPASVFVEFLNDAGEILAKLDEMESDLVSEAQSALNAAEKL